MTKQTKSFNLEQKILVVEDDREIRKIVIEASPELFEAPETLAEAEYALRQKKYSAILLDWKFYSSYTDDVETNGQEVAYLLREGHYGALNQNTPYIGFSSSVQLKGAIFQHWKGNNYNETRDLMVGLLEKLKKEGIIK